MSWSRNRRRAAVAVAALAVLAGLVGLGRWERNRWIANQTARMAHIRDIVGPLDQPRLSGYRVESGFDCLTYRRAANVFALELCFDPGGRLVEAIDRRQAHRVIGSLRTDPAASTLRADPRVVARLLHRMGAPV